MGIQHCATCNKRTKRPDLRRVHREFQKQNVNVAAYRFISQTYIAPFDFVRIKNVFAHEGDLVHEGNSQRLDDSCSQATL
jgi:hypothetical protein